MRTLLAALAMFAGSAASGPILDEAAGELRRDPVFVHPEADRSRGLSDSQAEDLRRAIDKGDAPIFVAVLPSSVEGEVDGGLNELASALGQATGLRGTYAVVTATGFRAASNALPEGVAADLATDAFNDRRGDGAAAVLGQFVEQVQDVRSSGGSGGSGGSSSDGGEDGGGGGVGGLLVVGGLAGGGVYLWRRKKKKDAELDQLLTGEQQDLRADLAVLADDVLRLEPEVALKPEARNDYEAGVARFKWAEAAIDTIDSPDDPPRVRRGMIEAQYAMARARAIVRGHEVPPPPIELARPGQYGEPAVELDESRQPVYAGYGGQGGGWGGGGYYGGNGLFTGLLLGQMLGGGMGWGGGFGWGSGGYDHHDQQDRGGDSGWTGGGGDFGGGGGGDWGGGGGDFGGGDSGGGDW